MGVCSIRAIIDNEGFKEELKSYLVDGNSIDEQSKNILAASHVYASLWEFEIIRQTNPTGYQIEDIKKLLLNDIEKYLVLDGMRKIITKNRIADFIDLVGQLRFQIRWGHTPRIPSTSVLGHSMMVACLSFFFSLEIKACPSRIRNNFFGGLFHDLPESVTRDIISPVKGAVEELGKVIGQIESELVREQIYPLIEEPWISEFEYFTKDEFQSKVLVDGEIKKVSSDEITKQYNHDGNNPIDGQIVKIADHLAAFVEAYKATESGIRTPQLEDGNHDLRAQYKNKTIGGVNIGSIYADF